MSDSEEELSLANMSLANMSLIVKQPIATYKSTVTFTGGVTDMRKYIQSYYSIYFNDTLWLVIQYKNHNEFTMIYKSNCAYIILPYKTREYITHNTPYVVNRVNQPLDIIISQEKVYVTYIEPYGDCVYHADFKFSARYECKISELQLITMLNKK